MLKRVQQIFILICLFLLVYSCMYSQRSRHSRYNPASNTVYVEFFGSSGGIYNVGFDKSIKIKANNKIALGAGIEYLHAMTAEHLDVLTFSPQASYIYGNTHHFEVGVAVVIDVINTELKVPFRIGYRYQQDEGGFFLRGGINPMVANGYFSPYGGIAIGWTL